MAALLAATGIGYAQVNSAQIGNYLVEVGSFSYGGSVSGSMYSGFVSGHAWVIQMLTMPDKSLEDYVYSSLANAVRTEKGTVSHGTITIDGKAGAWANGVIDMPITSNGQTEIERVAQFMAVYPVDDRAVCLLSVVGSGALFEDMIKTVRVSGG